MRIFYDNSIIRDAQLPESLRPIVDQLAIVLVPLELEDLTRIWNALQTPYRLSVVYEVRIVLIESTITTTPSRVTAKINLYGQKP
jgi:Pvc16 N-terminal domain